MNISSEQCTPRSRKFLKALIWVSKGQGLRVISVWIGIYTESGASRDKLRTCSSGRENRLTKSGIRNSYRQCARPTAGRLACSPGPIRIFRLGCISRHEYPLVYEMSQPSVPIVKLLQYNGGMVHCRGHGVGD